MFQFPGFPLRKLWIYLRVTSLQLAGFPHSDIKGSMPACGSPLLFAACHVLLRRLVPWHPPCALLRLITLLRLSCFFRLIEIYNWSSKDSFSSSFSVQLSRCAQDLSCSRIMDPENDTEFEDDSFFLGHSGLLPFLSFLPSFRTSLLRFVSSAQSTSV